ncbi:MAG: RagB/SusD protein, partial [Chitinophagaceae bacterium]|nr:RagB/SusD protein [Chitinophagaceae bacterium]
WSSAYNVIYISNIVIEGLSATKNLTPSVQSQLLGEAYFVRAFTHFYLTNLYGDVPFVISSAYQTTIDAPRAPSTDVYAQILKDLKMAEQLLMDAEAKGAYKYVTTERIRPNSYSAKFMLARIYLYTGDWANAESYATSVISKTDTYSLLTDLTQVFKPNTAESIWQLKPYSPTQNTSEGAVFVLNGEPTGGQNNFSLSPSITNDFETGDKRKTNWVSQFTSGSKTWNYASKYKLKALPVGGEYSVVFRLAEMYLVRAEARTRNSNVAQAIQDVDAIRGRAGIPLISSTNPGISATNLLTVIAHERKMELFTEWGHRWLDLKRTNKADEVLSVIKGSNWQPTDKLYALPQGEVTNGNRPQNPGY